VPTPTGEREGGAGSKESEISEAAAEGSVPQVLKNLQEEDLRDLQEEDSYNSLHSGSGCPLAPSHAHSLARARALSLSQVACTCFFAASFSCPSNLWRRCAGWPPPEVAGAGVR